MKTLTFTFATLISLSAFAMENSQLNPRHQEVIKKGVIEKCSLNQASFKEVRTEASAIRVDQGIVDYDYFTILQVTDQLDQGLTERYQVTVLSQYFDQYDHSAQDWGTYRVTAVKCDLL